MTIASSFKALGELAKAAKKAPYDDALALAQRRASLPVSEGGLGLSPANTPMERAAAIGYTTPAYHGTYAQDQIDKFDTGLAGLNRYGNTAETADLTTSRKVASGYAQRENAFGDVVDGGSVYPLVIDPRGFERIPKSIHGDDWMMADEIANRSTAPGMRFKGVTWDNADELKNDQFKVKDTSRIRSRFAAFDPFRRGESDLLAGMGPLVAPTAALGLAGAAMAPDEAEAGIASAISRGPAKGIYNQIITPPPELTIPGYRAHRVFESGQKAGGLYPVMIGKENAETALSQRIPMGAWLKSQFIPFGMAPRQGWHAGELPYGPQFNVGGKESGSRFGRLQPDDVIYSRVSLGADNNFSGYKSPTDRGVVFDEKTKLPFDQTQLPEGGFYTYRPSGYENPWLVSDKVRHESLLTDEEIADIFRAAGKEPPPPRKSKPVTESRLRELGLLGSGGVAAVAGLAGLAAPDEVEAGIAGQLAKTAGRIGMGAAQLQPTVKPESAYAAMMELKRKASDAARTHQPPRVPGLAESYGRDLMMEILNPINMLGLKASAMMYPRELGRPEDLRLVGGEWRTP